MRKGYDKLEGVNQSFLKKMFGSTSEITKDKKNKGMMIGDAVDTLMFAPDTFDKKFALYEGGIPTANAKLIIDEGFKTGEFFDNLIEVTRYLGLYPKYSDTSVWNKLNPFEDYYNLMRDGITLFDSEDFEKIHSTKYNLETSYTSEVVEFLNKYGDTQKILSSELLGLQCKGLADWYYENNTDKPVTFGQITVQPGSLLIADLKVGRYNPENVEKFIKEWDTGFQLTFYSLLAKYMTGLTITNPVVVYANANNNNTCYYQMPDSLLKESWEKIKECVKIYKQYDGDYSIHYRIKKNEGLIKPYLWK